MKGKRFFKYVALLVSLSAIVSACGAPATPAVPVTGTTPQVIEQTVEVQVTTVVEVTSTPGASSEENPYRPT
ncbi:MAG TPA: hypothetical protein VFQ13_15760, partial [Anaerolineales bacterium]|nr:hypothetical protein [Anaerolineales bacterium]